MKRCGHMFREKLPFSDLWTELRKVATLKRKVCLPFVVTLLVSLSLLCRFPRQQQDC
jgi:hypothetical protein